MEWLVREKKADINHIGEDRAVWQRFVSFCFSIARFYTHVEWKETETY